MDVERERLLVAALKQGDRKAFDEVVRHFKDRIFGLIYRMMGDAQEAEDVAQEVFVTLFMAIADFREEARLGTWLYRIAVNHCKNRLKYLDRRRRWQQQSLDQMTDREITQSRADGAPLGSRLPRPDHMAEGLQMERIVQQELAAMEPEQRMLILLRDVQGLTYQDIEQITGLPLGTVKSRLHRARMALKEKIQRYR
jgi:RNA polymerase sigma-70 factor (ECF subfamily)